MTADRCSLLVVDDESYLLPTFPALLAPAYEVFTASGADEAEAILRARPIDILLTDKKMPGRSGLDLLGWAREHSPSTVRLLMTGYAELDDAVAAINKGQVYHYLLKPWRTPELLQVLRNAAEKRLLEKRRDDLLAQLQALNRDLERRVSERTRELAEANALLEQRNRELERLALTDGLTGLLNRRAMDDMLAFELKRQARFRGGLAVGYVDADHFKNVNTEHLLTGGDEVLRGLARLISSCVREVDSVGRVGGEEFLVLARETSIDGAVLLAERIRATVEATPIVYKGKPIRVTVSAGFAVADGPLPEDADGLTRLAAEALAHAKATGRNRTEVRLYSPGTVLAGT
ncbi:MAG: diguanylate cyclase [Gemmataceae bacterium]|nr:diguanylate cyclase [Gemmataceae bacterium]